MAIPVLAFVGRSGCGKTTLLSILIPLLQAKGLRIGVIKHTRHAPLETDMPGTDTRRYWDAGTESVVLVGGDRVMMTRRHEEEPLLDSVLVAMDSTLDLIILEGYKRCGYPKVEVVRNAHCAKTLTDLEKRIAYVSDVTGLGADENLPRFDLDAYADIAAFIVEFVQKHIGVTGWAAS